MRRRLRLLAGIVGLAGALWAWQPVIAEVGPETAWWSRANGILPGVSMPRPPDVGENDLYVAGDGGDEQTWQAVAALDVVVPDGRTIDALTLRLSSSPVPAAPTILGLCPLRASFEPVANGRWADVPAHDCSSVIEGGADETGETVRFGGLGSLVANGHLRVLVVPVGVQRAVVQTPGPEAVTLSTVGGSVASTVPSSVAPTPTNAAAAVLPSMPSVSETYAPSRPGGAVASEAAAAPRSATSPAVTAGSVGRDWLVGILGMGGLVAICSDLVGSRRRARGRPRGVGHLCAPREGLPAPL